MSEGTSLAYALLGTGRVHYTDDCWYWTGPKSAGFGVLYHNGVTWKVHELAMHLLKPHVKAFARGNHIIHACNHPACINPAHLYWYHKPEEAANPFRRLNPFEIAEIARDFATGRAYPHELAQKYGVGEQKIRQAVIGYPGSWARFHYKILVNDRRD